MRQSIVGIYKITNQKTGEVYIGQSKDIQERWRKHRSDICKRDTNLYQAMRQYGLDCFKFEILQECDVSELNALERYYIEMYNSLEEGYNMSTIKNLQQKISWTIASQIIEDLKDLTILQKDIAKKYDVSHSLISQINYGKMWYNPEISYPIRERQSQKKEKKISQGDLLSREELKSLIREHSFVEIGRKYGVSDNAVRKWCDKHNLPRKKSDIKRYSDEEWNQI